MKKSLLFIVFLMSITAQAQQASCTPDAIGNGNGGTVNNVVSQLQGPCKNEPASSTNKMRMIDNQMKIDGYGKALWDNLGENNFDDVDNCSEVWACGKGDCKGDKDQKALSQANTNEMGNWVRQMSNSRGDAYDASRRPGLFNSYCFLYSDQGKGCENFVKNLAKGDYQCVNRSSKKFSGDKFTYTPASQAMFDNMGFIIDQNLTGDDKEKMKKELADFEEKLKAKDSRALVNYWQMQRLKKDIESASSLKDLQKNNPNLTQTEVDRMKQESLANAYLFMLRTREGDRDMVLSCDAKAASYSKSYPSSSAADMNTIKKMSTSQLKAAERGLDNFFAKNGFDKSGEMLSGFSLDESTAQTTKIAEKEEEVAATTWAQIPLYASGKVELKYENGGRVCPEDKYLTLPQIKDGFVDNRFEDLTDDKQKVLDSQISQIKQFVQEGNTVEKFRILSSASTYRNTETDYGDACPEILKFGAGIPEVAQHCANGAKWPNAKSTTIPYAELSILRSLEVKKKVMEGLEDPKGSGKYLVDPNSIAIEWQGSNYIDCSTATPEMVKAHPLYNSWMKNHKNTAPKCADLAKYNGTSGPLSPYEDKTTTATHKDYEQYKYVQLQVIGKGKVPPIQEQKVSAKPEALASSMNCSATVNEPGTVNPWQKGGTPGKVHETPLPSGGKHSPVSCPVW